MTEDNAHNFDENSNLARYVDLDDENNVNSINTLLDNKLQSIIEKRNAKEDGSGKKEADRLTALIEASDNIKELVEEQI